MSRVNLRNGTRYRELFQNIVARRRNGRARRVRFPDASSQLRKLSGLISQSRWPYCYCGPASPFEIAWQGALANLAKS